MRKRVGTDIGIKLLPVMWVFRCKIMSDSASLRSFAEQRYDLARCVAPRDLGLLNRVATAS